MSIRPAVLVVMVSVVIAHAAPTIYQDVEPEYHVGDTIRLVYGPYPGGLFGDRVMISKNGRFPYRWCLSEQMWYGLTDIDTMYFEWKVRSTLWVCDSITAAPAVSSVSDSCRIAIMNLGDRHDTAYTSLFRILPAVGVIARRVPASTTNVTIDAPAFDLRGRVDDGSQCGVKVINSRQINLRVDIR